MNDYLLDNLFIHHLSMRLSSHLSIYLYIYNYLVQDPTRSVYCLTSVNLLRKYSWLVDVPMTYFVCGIVYMASPAQWLQVQGFIY